jgi:hypothetical protein
MDSTTVKPLKYGLKAANPVLLRIRQNAGIDGQEPMDNGQERHRNADRVASDRTSANFNIE